MTPGRPHRRDAPQRRGLTTTNKEPLFIMAKPKPAHSLDEIEACAARLLARAATSCDPNLRSDLRMAAYAITRVLNTGRLEEVAR